MRGQLEAVSSIGGLLCYNRSSEKQFFFVMLEMLVLQYELELVTDDMNDINSDILTLSAGLCIHLIRNNWSRSSIQCVGERRFNLEILSL